MRAHRARGDNQEHVPGKGTALEAGKPLEPPPYPLTTLPPAGSQPQSRSVTLLTGSNPRELALAVITSPYLHAVPRGATLLHPATNFHISRTQCQNEGGSRGSMSYP